MEINVATIVIVSVLINVMGYVMHSCFRATGVETHVKVIVTEVVKERATKTVLDVQTLVLTIV